MRRIRWILALVGLVLVPTAILAAPAAAAPFSLCKDAPVPVSPKTGLPGLLTTVPADIPATAPDPFADPKIAIGDVYGYGWHWSNYDLGCGNDFLRDPTAVTNTTTGNILLSIGDGILASLATLEQMAKTLPLNWLTAGLQSVTAALKDQILTLWFPLATAALAGLVLWRAKKASYHETAKVAAVFVAAVALAAFSLLYPVIASKQVDKAVTTVANVTGSTFAVSATDSVNRQSAYRTWLAGSFGDAESPAAKKYGPSLMSATHYTWSDWKRIQDNPDAKAAIDKAKAAEFKKVAEQLQTEDPSAYETFTGRGERTGPALLGIVDIIAMGLFAGLSALMIVVARVMMQGLTFIAPLVAVVSILPKHHNALAKLWDLFTAALVAVAKFTIAGGVMTVVLGALQGADLSGAGRLFFILVATIVGIVLTKPLRSLKTLVPGLDPGTSYLKKMLQYVGPALAGGAGSYAGVRSGVHDAGAEVDGTDGSQPVAPRSPTATAGHEQTTAYSLSALPRPVWTTPALDAALISMPTWAPESLPAAPVEAIPTVVPTSAPTALPVGAGTAQQPAALPAARLALEAAPQEATAFGASAPPLSTPAPAADDAVVYPDAIIVRTDPSLYHPGGPAEEYIPASELELGEDGTEAERIVYHAPSSEA